MLLLVAMLLDCYKKHVIKAKVEKNGHYISMSRYVDEKRLIKQRLRTWNCGLDVAAALTTIRKPRITIRIRFRIRDKVRVKLRGSVRIGY